MADIVEKPSRKAWHEKTHANFFDGFYSFSDSGIKKLFESFNEIRIFRELKDQIKGKNLVELGCATGDLYRYINLYHKDISYSGVDISQPAIERAKLKFPNGRFFLCEESDKPKEIIDKLGLNADILFARDVVLHQPNPFEFFKSIISVPNELAILRIRTRDKGETVLDPQLSCQWNYNAAWVPYMILNVDEVITAIKETVNFESLYIYKRYITLGGHERRYLPKDCYYSETGTAETAVGIKITREKVEKPKIVIKGIEETYSDRIIDKKPGYILRRFIDRIL